MAFCFSWNKRFFFFFQLVSAKVNEKTKLLEEELFNSGQIMRNTSPLEPDKNKQT